MGILLVSQLQIMKLRTKFNKKLEKDGVKLSVNDFVLKATALASKKVPEANSAWMGTFIRMYVFRLYIKTIHNIYSILLFTGMILLIYRWL